MNRVVLWTAAAFVVLALIVVLYRPAGSASSTAMPTATETPTPTATAIETPTPTPSPLGTVRARLRGSREVPAVSTQGRGDFRATLTRDAIRYELSYAGLEGTATVAMIRYARRFQNVLALSLAAGGIAR